MSKNLHSRKLLQLSALLIAALGILVIIFVFIDGLTPQKDIYREKSSSDKKLYTPDITIEASIKPTAQSTPSTIEKPPPMGLLQNLQMIFVQLFTLL